MRNIKTALRIKPQLITFGIITIIYVILSFFSPFDAFTTLIIFVLIALMSYSLANIIFSLAPGFISASERIMNILHSTVIFLLTSISLTLSMEKPMFSIEVVMSFLIISFFVIGGGYIVFGLINTGFPKHFRLNNFLLGFITIILSLIALIFPLLGYLLLAIVMTSLTVIKKAFEVES